MKTLAEYGLKSNPFSSQGSETGKYPYVEVKEFKKLIHLIEEIKRTSDASAVIVQGPQGSGKTAARNGLVKYFSNQPEIGIITVNLSSLDVVDLTWSIVDYAKNKNLVDDAFIAKIGWEEGKHIEKPKAEKIITQILEEILSKNKFGILIIDEFDTIALPQFVDTPDQSLFLLNMTNILNSINESKIIQKRFCTVLAQTSLSAEKFRNYLIDKHKALLSRIPPSNLVDMASDIDETKEIIRTRLETDAIDGFNKPSNTSEFFPLTDEIIKWLFDRINKANVTPLLNDFRTMEQVLHASIEKSMQLCLEGVELNIVEEVYETLKPKVSTSSPARKLSKETQEKLEKSLKDPNKNTGNCLYLNGIQTAMRVWEDREYESVAGQASAVAELDADDPKQQIFISSIKINVTAKESNLEKTILWYTVAKGIKDPNVKTGTDSFTDNEFTRINSWLQEQKIQQVGAQRVLLTIFTDSPGISEEELQQQIITSVDRIYYRDGGFKAAIMGIFLAQSEEERNQFRLEWDSSLHSICNTYLGSTLFDIGQELVPTTGKQKGSLKHIRLIQYLHLKSIEGTTVNSIELKNWGKILSNALVRDRELTVVKNSGFTDDEYKALVPRNLMSLKILIDLQKNGEKLEDDKIVKIFGNKFTIDVAKHLKVVTPNNELINVEELEKSVTVIIGAINQVLNNKNATNPSYEQLELFKAVFDKIDSVNDYFKKVIVLQIILERAPTLITELEQAGNVPVVPPEGVSATAISDKEIQIDWNVTGSFTYDIEHSEDQTDWISLESTPHTTPHTHTSLTPESTHYYRITASNGTKTSSASATVSATTLEEGTEKIFTCHCGFETKDQDEFNTHKDGHTKVPPGQIDLTIEKVEEISIQILEQKSCGLKELIDDTSSKLGVTDKAAVQGHVNTLIRTGKLHLTKPIVELE